MIWTKEATKRLNAFVRGTNYVYNINICVLHVYKNVISMGTIIIRSLSKSTEKKKHKEILLQKLEQHKP